MTLGKRLIKAYFNYAYNPIYDFTTGRLSCYHRLQEKCIGKLKLEDNDRVLCLGLGTGNEIARILAVNGSVSITGVDYSAKALRRAQRKAQALGKEIEVLTMDAQCLEFAEGSFDEVVCIHVMDFVGDDKKVAGEIIRVLKDGGQFVISYPSRKEGMSLGLSLWRDIIRSSVDAGGHRAAALLRATAQMLAGTIYFPLFLRPEKISYSRDELHTVITGLGAGELQIEGDPVYQDYIVYGRK